MYIVIVGGGNVGYYLIKTLAAEKHQLMLVESDRHQCEIISAELDESNVEVTHGNGTDVEVLREAGINRADALIAVTGQDQNNLVACQLAKDYFGVKHTISRVHNPKNIRVFEKLGVDSVISSTARIAGIINQEIDWNDVNKLLKSKSVGIRIREVNVQSGSEFINKKLSEINLPKGVIVVSIIRGDEAIIPNGESQLQLDDDVIIMGKENDIIPAMALFSSNTR